MSMAPDMEKLRGQSINKLGADAALDHIATLIDSSLDHCFPRGGDRALFLLDELSKRELSPMQGALVEYFRANAWGAKEALAGNRGSWDWEQSDCEQQILALSKAAAHPGFVDLDVLRRCQILTNRANLLNTIGRFVDAIEGWDKALEIIPVFAIALANRGYGLKSYGGLLEADRERAIFLLHAYDGLMLALAPNALYDSEDNEVLRIQFAATSKSYAAAADLERIRALQHLNGPLLGRSKAERTYRRWCVDHRLFLNPLNDLGAFTTAATDQLHLPTIVESFEDRPSAVTPPPLIGFFNQMKQEYASARFMLYEGLNSTKVHFSDRGVRLFDTLDFPAHSLAIERVRTAYRIAYSLLDKVAFMVDHYWKLGKIADRINFKNVWMVEGKARLLDRFKAHANWPLRGLYWLSKELFDEQLKRSTAADARELHDIRNALEHKYLQIHEGWAWDLMLTRPVPDALALSIDSDLLEAKALRVFRIARAALIQLAAAIGVEEREKGARSPAPILGSMPIYGLDEQRKRRDPKR